MPTLTPNQYYPALSDLIKVDDLPEFLSFIKDGVNSLFDKMYYKDYQVSNSVSGSNAFYKLDIISRSRIDWELPGTGIKFILNPDYTSSTISSFPITVFWEWEVLRYIRYFNLTDFSFTPEDFFNLTLAILNISEEQVIKLAMNTFVVQSDPNLTQLHILVQDINTFLSSNISVDTDSENAIQDLMAQISLLDKEIAPIIFSVYLLSNDLSIVKEKINTFFSAFIPEDIESYIRKIVTPRARVTLELSAAIEFPKSILKPVNPDGSDFVDISQPDIKTQFRFAQALLYADTQAGVGFQLELAGSLHPQFAAIGNTGILLQIESLKLDLSKKTNIPEATADGRSVDFTGVYARALSVTLPARWFHDDATPGTSSTTLRLGGYDLLVGTGGISGTIALETVASTISGGPIYYFEDKFQIHFPISVFQKNTTTNVIEEVIIDDVAGTGMNILKTYLYPTGGTNIPPCPIKFPITVSESNIATGIEKTFTSLASYQQYLNSFPNDNVLNPIPTLWKRIGGPNGFRIGFNKFDITFKQNKVVHSEIIAQLEIPKLKNGDGSSPFRALINGHLDDNGDFNVSAAFAAPGIQAKIGNFISFNFSSLELGKQENDFYIGTSVKIGFPSGLMHNLLGDQEIVIPKIRFFDNGRFEIIGGNGFLPVNITLPLGPVKMSVTGIHIGSIQREYQGQMRKYNYVGFDGAISINPLGIDARGDGLKYYYTTDDDEHAGNGNSFLHIKSIEIDIVVPNDSPTFSLHGMLSIPEPGASQEYVGEVSFKSTKTKLAGYAGMKLAPKFPAFLIDAEVNLPKPIPIGAIAVYGFRGLIGYRYVATKSAISGFNESSTWYDYFKYPKIGVNIQKFKGPYDSSGYNNPFSIGVGAVLGTSADQGKVIALRAMLVLSLPSLFMIEARAYILDELPNLDDGTDPPFWAVIAFGENSFEIGMGVDYLLPKNKGTILDLHANAHAYFPVGSGGQSWYLHIGTRENPNTARLFKDVLNLSASSYLMLASQGIEFGAKVGFELNKNFFGIKVHLWAYIEIGAKISFERPQFGGYLHFGGGIEVNVWRIIYLGFDLNCYLSGEAVKPYLIYAEMNFRGRIKICFFKISFNVRLKLMWEKDNQVIMSPVPILANGENGSLDRRLELVKGVHMLTNEEFEIQSFNGLPNISQINKYIPLDTFIDIKFTKPVSPNNVDSLIGGHTSGADNFIELIPPEKIVKGGRQLRQVSHLYSIESIEIKACTDAQQNWVDYNPYNAIKPDLVSDIKLGYWQRSGNQYDSIRLLANTPFSYLDAGEPGWFIPEQYGITASNLFCSEEINLWHSSNVLNKTLGSVYPITGQTNGYDINGAFYYPIGDFAVQPNYADYIPFNTFKITNDINNAWPLYDKSIAIGNNNGLAIILPEDAIKTRLKIYTTAQSVNIKYYRSPDLVEFGTINTGFVLVLEVNVLATDLNQEVIYENLPSNPIIPIIKIEIIPSSPELDAINLIREQIASLFTDSYTATATAGTNPEINITTPSNLELYNQLLGQLNQLLSHSCVPAPPHGPETINDAVICNLYLELQNIHCFDFIINDVSNLDIEGINLFGNALLNFDHVFGILIYGVEISTYFSAYLSFLTNFNQAIAEMSSPEVIMGYYNQLYGSALSLLDGIIKVGRCPIPNQAACITTFQEINWKTFSDYQFELTVPSQEAVLSEMQAMQEAITHNVQPVWRPNTIYYIHFVLKDLVANANTHNFNYYYGFRTAGPIGHFHDAAGVTYGNELNSTGAVINRKDKDGVLSPFGKLVNPDKHSLTSLRNYIDYQRSYPNADSNLLQFKPLFYGENQCRIDLFFIKPFAYHMFNDWPTYNNLQQIKGTINIAIKDPIADVIIPYPLPIDYSEALVPIPENQNGSSHWTDDNDPRIPIAVRNLINIMANGTTPCNIEIGEPLSPMSYSYSIKLTSLKPQKLYTAIVYNAFDKNTANNVGDDLYHDYIDVSRNIIENENNEVHKFVFQTSRYANFSEQVNSFILNETTKAIFSIEKEFSANSITNAFEIVSKNNINIDPAISSIYLDLFDRVFEGIFNFKQLDPPNTTEFNLIKDNLTGNIIAVLVRNPEPFNNPRIPMLDIQDTIQIMTSNDSNAVQNNNYKVLHSKDYSQAIIMHNSLQINETVLNLQFQYKIWNGTAYTVDSTNVLNKVNLELIIK